jgi:U4/U6 small nuclear ribonucleoprotein PRP3
MMVGDDDIDDERNAAGEDGGGGTKTKVKKRKKFNPDNECVLIWSGMAIKRAFHSFMFQHAESSVVARKILEAKGVAHYWDLAVGHAERKAGDGGSWNGDGELKFRLGDGAGG